MNTMMNFRVM